MMTIDEALIQLRLGPGINEDVSEEYNKAVDMAIEALQQQPSEDCISRQFMRDMGATCIAARNKDGDLVALGALDILPSVTPQQKTGHWLSQSEMNNLIPSGLGCYFWCSECNCGIDYKYFHLTDYKYCPKCGAKMQEVQQ